MPKENRCMFCGHPAGNGFSCRRCWAGQMDLNDLELIVKSLKLIATNACDGDESIHAQELLNLIDG